MGELESFPGIRYNKLVERLNRYEELLLGCLKLFELEGLNIVDSKPVETKRLARFGRHRKRGTSAVIREEESIGFNPSKGGFYLGYKATCCTDGRYMTLLHVDPANRHDLSIMKENRDDFAKRFRGSTVLLDKGYIDTKFAEEMRRRGVGYTTIKRDNTIKNEEERTHYKILSRIRRIIETRFSQLEEFGSRFIRAISRRGLAEKIILSILSLNIQQMMREV